MIAKKPFLERIVAADGQGPLLVYVIACTTAILLGCFLHFWPAVAPHLQFWARLRVQ